MSDSACGLAAKLAAGPTSSHWRKVGLRRRSGIAVPLFALRSSRGCGIGDVEDLRHLADWACEVGASVLQILPINDTGMDSVPYAALSAFALDPVYLALDRVEGIRSSRPLKERVRETARRLNASPRVDYAAVRREKMEILWEAFRRFQGLEMQAALDRFASANPWLEDYLLYRVIKETEGFRSWEEWGPRYAQPGALLALRDSHAERINFHLFLQLLLEEQMVRVRRHLERKGILLQGDIPILVARDSADVWRHPEYFRLDTAAGAPPDMYARDGQNWGFPTYSWDALARDGYGWWRQRLKQAEKFYDLYRIDHVVGFFRIWSIPYGERTGRNGRFDPAEERTWGEHGRKLLSMMIESTSMLPLAEDLGTIPPVCRQTLEELGICGLRVQRWEKWWDGDRSFARPDQYPVLSVSTLSTHDSELVPEWWEKEPAERQQLWTALGHEGPAPETLPAKVHRELLAFVGRTASEFAIHQLQELLFPLGLLPGPPADHRVNVPATISDRNWSWRCPVGLEELVRNAEWTAQVREMLRR